MAEHDWAARAYIPVTDVEAADLFDALLDGDRKEVPIDLAGRSVASVEGMTVCLKCRLTYDLGRDRHCVKP